MRWLASAQAHLTSTKGLAAAVLLILTSCSAEPGGPQSGEVAPAAAADEMGEPHDQSAFGKDPSQTDIMSPDEPDLHPAPPADGTRPRESFTLRSRKALVTTLTLDSAMAAAAIAGESSQPNTG